MLKLEAKFSSKLSVQKVLVTREDCLPCFRYVKWKAGWRDAAFRATEGISARLCIKLPG
jgi:hypothetical protein